MSSFTSKRSAMAHDHLTGFRQLTSAMARLNRRVIRAATVRKRFAALSGVFVGPLPHGRGSVQPCTSNGTWRSSRVEADWGGE